jgi:hypothetical protein
VRIQSATSTVGCYSTPCPQTLMSGPRCVEGDLPNLHRAASIGFRKRWSHRHQVVSGRHNSRRSMRSSSEHLSASARRSSAGSGRRKPPSPAVRSGPLSAQTVHHLLEQVWIASSGTSFRIAHPDVSDCNPCVEATAKIPVVEPHSGRCYFCHDPSRSPSAYPVSAPCANLWGCVHVPIRPLHSSQR